MGLQLYATKSCIEAFELAGARPDPAGYKWGGSVDASDGRQVAALLVCFVDTSKMPTGIDMARKHFLSGDDDNKPTHAAGLLLLLRQLFQVLPEPQEPVAFDCLGQVGQKAPALRPDEVEFVAEYYHKVFMTAASLGILATHYLTLAGDGMGCLEGVNLKADVYNSLMTICTTPPSAHVDMDGVKFPSVTPFTPLVLQVSQAQA